MRNRFHNIVSKMTFEFMRGKLFCRNTIMHRIRYVCYHRAYKHIGIDLFVIHANDEMILNTYLHISSYV